MKRFQECNRIVKIWRYRWYLAIPFVFLWRTISFEIFEDEVVDGKVKPTGETINVDSATLWGICVGDAQFKMEWHYTHEEVKASMNEKFKNLRL